MNDNGTNVGTFEYARVFDYQIHSDKYTKPYDCYCKPLKWYIDLYCKCSNKKPDTIGELEKSLQMSQGILSKRLNPRSKQHSTFRPEEIDQICCILETPLSVILYLYEHQSIMEENVNLKRNFDDIIFLLTGGIEKIIENAGIFRGFSQDEASKYTQNETSVASADNSALKRWEGKWYFYFPSSDSGIIKERKKKIGSSAVTSEVVEKDLKELFDLYSDDHIFCGTLYIRGKDNKYTAKLQYLTNPRRPVIARLDGNITFSQHNRAIFITPNAQKDNEIIYIIVHTTNDDPEAEFAAASILTISKNRVIKRRRPCSMRMILSRNPIATDSRLYKILCSELMMNDDVIRIDENGYSELKKYRDEYQSVALNKFLEIYPDIDALENDNRIDVSKCAYIKENLIGSINGIKEMGEDEILYLEALLRIHSTAQWYSKIKAEKSEKLEYMEMD